MKKERFFYGTTLEQAKIKAATALGIDEKNLKYREIKKDSYLDTKRFVVIAVDVEKSVNSSASSVDEELGSVKDLIFELCNFSFGDFFKFDIDLEAGAVKIKVEDGKVDKDLAEAVKELVLAVVKKRGLNVEIAFVSGEKTRVDSD